MQLKRLLHWSTLGQPNSLSSIMHVTHDHVTCLYLCKYAHTLYANAFKTTYKATPCGVVDQTLIPKM